MGDVSFDERAPAGRAGVIDRVVERRDELVERNVQRLWSEVPGYADVPDQEFYDAAIAYNARHHALMFDHLRAGTMPTYDELEFMRGPTSQRVHQVRIEAYLQAFRTSHDFHLQQFLDEAVDDATRDVVLGLVQPLLRYINFTAGYAAELYVEYEQLDRSGSQFARRQLLEDLLASRPPRDASGVAGAAGLGPTVPCFVTVAVPCEPTPDGRLRSAASAIARVCTGTQTPLLAIRDDEVVVVAPARSADVVHVAIELSAAYERLCARGIPLAIGMSTIHSTWDGVPSAYREAREAAEVHGPAGGVLALPTLRAFDYVTGKHDPVLERLIDPRIRRFVEADAEHGGVLSATLLSYVEANLNIKALSEAIHVHPNTARYRLNRIAEQTGRDMRLVGDVLDLMIAIRSSNPGAHPSPG